MAVESMSQHDAAPPSDGSGTKGQQELDASMDAFQEVIYLTRVSNPTSDDGQRLKDKLTDALQHGENFLAKVKLTSTAPGFEEEFRFHYLDGLRQMRNGFTTGNSEEFSKGAKMVNQYLDWMGRQPKN